jgi:hypothetical protein
MSNFECEPSAQFSVSTAIIVLMLIQHSRDFTSRYRKKETIEIRYRPLSTIAVAAPPLISIGCGPRRDCGEHVVHCIPLII